MRSDSLGKLLCIGDFAREEKIAITKFNDGEQIALVDPILAAQL